MIRIAVMGLTAAAAMVLGASAAFAGGVDVHLNLNPGIGIYPSHYPVYSQPVYVEADEDCEYVTKWKWVKKPSGQLKKKKYTKLVCY